MAANRTPTSGDIERAAESAFDEALDPLMSFACVLHDMAKCPSEGVHDKVRVELIARVIEALGHYARGEGAAVASLSICNILKETEKEAHHG